MTPPPDRPQRPSRIDAPIPSPLLSLHAAAEAEAHRHKWIESQRAGRDLGEAALRHWVREHWGGFLRRCWIEHPEGHAYWIELDRGDFGLLLRRLRGSWLLDEVLRRIEAEGENLGILCWCHECRLDRDEIEEVLAILEALDGSVIAEVHRQLHRLPGEASHLALAVGGNDLLGEVGVLGQAVGTVGEGVQRLADIRDRFGAAYAGLLRAVESLGRPAVACTLYEPRFRDAGLRREAATALCLFNVVILRAAHEVGLPVLELRALCSEEGDYATPVEPCSAGGEKIARALCEVVVRHDFDGGRSVIYP